MDLAISRWVANNLHTPFLDWLMPMITALGEAGFVWILLCLLLLCRKSTRRWGVICAGAMLLAFLGGEVLLKNSFRRARPFTLLPEVSLLIVPPHSYSFPSGHAGSSFAAATALFLMNRKAGVWALTLAFLIAFSRLYLTVHFLSDVLAGAVLGIASAFLARWLCEKKDWGEAL